MIEDWVVLLSDEEATRDGYFFQVIEKHKNGYGRIARRGESLDEALQNCYAAIRGQNEH